jgi:2-C-methyl-D-erythritol 4-phosphate cytidylyltransferase
MTKFNQRDMKSVALIVAGGTGSRMGGGTPKQFLELQGRPVLVHAVEAFTAALPDIEVIVVLPASHLEEGGDIFARHLPEVGVLLAKGGETRFHSVRNGLSLVKESSVIFVHDAARCLVTPDLIRRCHRLALEKGSAVPVVPVRDSMRRVDDTGHIVVDREQLRAVQTPQTFRSDILLPAFAQPWRAEFTDEATVVEAYGQPVELLEGEPDNIKVTYPVDLVVAAQVLEARLT